MVKLELRREDIVKALLKMTSPSPPLLIFLHSADARYAQQSAHDCVRSVHVARYNLYEHVFHCAQHELHDYLCIPDSSCVETGVLIYVGRHVVWLRHTHGRDGGKRDQVRARTAAPRNFYSVLLRQGGSSSSSMVANTGTVHASFL